MFRGVVVKMLRGRVDVFGTRRTCHFYGPVATQFRTTFIVDTSKKDHGLFSLVAMIVVEIQTNIKRSN
jgi:hypothetical protein